MIDGHLTIGDIHSDNYGHYIEKPDEDFSPERNYQVIAQVIEENRKMQDELGMSVKKEAADKADILASYGVARLGGKTEKTFSNYMGREWMKKIFGDKILEKARIIEARNGNLRDFHLT